MLLGGGTAQPSRSADALLCALVAIKQERVVAIKRERGSSQRLEEKLKTLFRFSSLTSALSFVCPQACPLMPLVLV